jgi:hypothetical protein
MMTTSSRWPNQAPGAVDEATVAIAIRDSRFQATHTDI